MKTIAFIIVILAFLAGAYMTSLDPAEIEWTWFIPIIVAGFIASLLYRNAANAAARQEHVLENNKTVLTQSLDNILGNLEKLDGRKSEVPTYEMRFEIDKLFREDLITFAEARESMKHLYGVQAYADVMSSFAAGERYINRVWSASTDGYVDEVLMYVGKALSQFEHARDEMKRVSAG